LLGGLVWNFKGNYLNSSLEETLTAFAREDSIMKSRYFVSADWTGAKKFDFVAI